MVTPSSAPPGGAAGQAPRPPGRVPYRAPGSADFSPPPAPPRARLTRTQQTRLVLVSAIMVMVGVALGLVATVVLPHQYAAQAQVLYALDKQDGTDDNADRTLTTQTVLATSRQVLQAVADQTGVPLDYLTKNVTATVVPNSEVIQIQVVHPDRPSGIQLATAVTNRYLALANVSAPQSRLQSQLEGLNRQLNNPVTPPEAKGDIQTQISELNQEIAAQADASSVATVTAPAFSVPAPVFPNTLITLAVGALVGLVLAALVAARMVSSFTRR